VPDQAPPWPAARRSRRAHQRYVLVGQAATLHLGGVAHPCTVRNISSSGLMAGIYQAELDTGPAEVEFPSGERLAGSVLWVRDWQLGLSFDQPRDVSGLLARLEQSDAPPDRRADERAPVDCAAKLRVGGRFYFGRIADISAGGARFCTSGRLKRAGESVLIVPDLPPLPSTIRWARDGEFGLEFRERMPAAALESWLEARST
jgi:hypothetical protein